MDDDLRHPALSFGPVADAYDRGRPGFPAAAARWLVGRDAATVLELGAGTGKLTRELVALGHDVHATDPDPAMLGVLQKALPDVRTSVAGAEEIPLADRSVDVVVAAQAFHWFDHERALPEIARVLRPGGHVAVCWNLRDERIPWVRKLGRALGSAAAAEDADSTEALVQSDLFGFVDEQVFSHWQHVDRDSVVDMAASRSQVASLEVDEREAVLDRVRALYDDYGRGMDGMQIPYDCRCYRARVNDRPDVPGEPEATPAATSGEEDGAAGGPTEPPTDGSGTLLIDFR
jgi:SAM-dependent methyltransferase